jgi:hypothetical protein
MKLFLRTILLMSVLPALGYLFTILLGFPLVDAPLKQFVQYRYESELKSYLEAKQNGHVGFGFISDPQKPIPPPIITKFCPVPGIIVADVAIPATGTAYRWIYLWYGFGLQYLSHHGTVAT